MITALRIWWAARNPQNHPFTPAQQRVWNATRGTEARQKAIHSVDRPAFRIGRA